MADEDEYHHLANLQTTAMEHSRTHERRKMTKICTPHLSTPLRHWAHLDLLVMMSGMVKYGRKSHAVRPNLS